MQLSKDVLLNRIEHEHIRSGIYLSIFDVRYAAQKTRLQLSFLIHWISFAVVFLTIKIKSYLHATLSTQT